MANPKHNTRKNAYMDLQPGIPLVEICGNRRVLIENHKGITCYGGKEIFVKVKKGDIHVVGDGLFLCRMNKTKLVITGKITAIHMHAGASDECN